MGRVSGSLKWMALLVVAACYREVAPEPPSFSQPIDQAPRDRVLEYARRVPYLEISGDSQRLMLGNCPNDCRYGPLAHIDPASRSYEFNETALRAGRVLARVINVDTIAYPKLNLGPRDTVYWWVDGARGALRSVLVSSRPEAPPLVLGFRREAHPEQRKGFEWRQAQGRFYWRDADEMLWVACAWAECCRTDEALQ